MDPQSIGSSVLADAGCDNRENLPSAEESGVVRLAAQMRAEGIESRTMEEARVRREM